MQQQFSSEMTDHSIEAILRGSSNSTEIPCDSSRKKERDTTSSEQEASPSPSSPSSPTSSEKRPKRPRHTYTAEQTQLLEQTFIATGGFLDRSTKKWLSNEIQVQPEQSQVWFQNRRSKYRKRESPRLNRPLHQIPHHLFAGTQQYMQYYQQPAVLPLPYPSVSVPPHSSYSSSSPQVDTTSHPPPISEQ